MALSTDSVKARLTQKFYTDIQNALKPLVQSNSFALKLEVRIDPKFGEKLQRATDRQLRAFGDTPDLPGLVLQAHTDSLSDLIGLNAKDEDLLPYVTKVDVTVTVDKSLTGPPARVIKDVVKSSINPLKKKRADLVKVVYEDLAVLYSKADRPRSGNNASSLKTTEADSAAKKTEEKKELPLNSTIASTIANDPASHATPLSGFSHGLEVTLSSPLLTGIVVLSGLMGLTLFLMKKTKTLREKAEHSLDAFSKFPTTLSESARAMSGAISALKTPAQASTPTPSSVKVELVGAGGKALSPKTIQKIVHGPEPKETPHPEVAYYGEKQVLAKIQKLFEKSDTLAVILSHYLSDGKKVTEIVRLLKVLSPEQIKMLATHLNSDSLEKMLKLSSGSHRAKIDYEKLGQFIDKMMAEFTSRVLEEAASEKSSEVLYDLSAEELAEMIGKADANLRACVVSLIPEHERSIYFQALNLSKPEKDEIMARLIQDSKQLFEKVALDLFLGVAAFHYKAGRIDALLKLHEISKQHLPTQQLKLFSSTLESWLGSPDLSHIKAI